MSKDRSTSRRPSVHGLRPISRAGCLVAIAGGILGLVQPAGAVAEPQNLAEALTQPRDPLDLTGRSFAGIRLPVGVTPGLLEFEASRVWAWREGAGVRGDGSERKPTDRLMLSGDVRLSLGGHEFEAAQAVVWMSELEPDDPDYGVDVRQVFILFDRVGTPQEDAVISLSADRLSVQAVIAPVGEAMIQADVLFSERPEDPLVFEGERTLGMHLRRVVRGTDEAIGEEGEVGQVGQGEPGRADVGRPFDAAVHAPSRLDLEALSETLPAVEGGSPIFAEEGVIALSTGDISIIGGDEETVAIIDGADRGVIVQYQGPDRSLELRAQRVVVFLEPGRFRDLDFARLDVKDVHGIYLEGGVIAGDGQYTLRAPVAYYDVRLNRAAVLDAVFWTYDQKRRLPIYMRAKALRMESADQFSAGSTTLTSTAFFDPELSLGASSVTLSRRERPDGTSSWLADAKNIAVRAFGVPVFYWPWFYGDPTQIPITRAGFENSSGSGTAFKTAWDVFGLLGIEAPAGVNAEALIEYFIDRGPALGTDINWNTSGRVGRFLAYMLPNDTGTDLFKSGAEEEVDGRMRGAVLAENRWHIDENWSADAQLTYFSDEGFAQAFFRPLTEQREAMTGISANRLDDNSALNIQMTGSLNDFVVSDYLIQSLGYQTHKLPEVQYSRFDTPNLPGLKPGAIEYFSEYRAGRLQLSFTEPTVSELGFDTRGRARNAFGLRPDDSIGDSLRSAGYSESDVYRLDTRHEIATVLSFGPVKFRPFMAGRLTYWDNDFQSFRAANDESSVRMWGSAGATVSTAIHHIDDSVESSAFDLHRMRHVVEPSLTIWTAGANIGQNDLPIYDDDVESLATGTAINIGLNQTWQTQRGGLGRRHTVDVFKLSTRYVTSSDDADRESPYPRFIDFRPEYSSLGEFARVDAAWQVSDAVAIGAGSLYDFETNQQARSLVGLVINHTPEFSTFAEVRFLNPQDSTYVSFSSRLQLTSKYSAGAGLVFDTDRDEFQSVSASLERRLRSVVLGVNVSHNEISGDTGIGFILLPLGLPEGATRVRGLGSSSERGQGARAGG